MRRRPRRRFGRSIFDMAAVATLLVISGCQSTGVNAQSPPASSGIPALSGIWKLNRQQPSFKPPVYTARALAMAKAFDEVLSPTYDCQQLMTPFLMRNFFNSEIVQQPDRVLLRYEKDDVVRTVWLEGHGHAAPGAYDYTIQGHSAGRYENNQLVVVTTKFAWSPIGLSDDGGGPTEPFHVPASALKKVTERYWREGNRLKADVTTEDPLILREPFHFTLEWERDEKATELVRYACTPEDSRYPAQFQPSKYPD